MFRFSRPVVIAAVLAASFAVVLISCNLRSLYSHNAEDLAMKASALTKLTRASEWAVRNDPPKINEDALAYITRDEPFLLNPFKGYWLDFKGSNLGMRKFAILLVCTEDRKYALLEDISCTAGLDIDHSLSNNVPCKFTIGDEEIKRLCVLKTK